MILYPEDFLQKAKEVAAEGLPFVLFKYPNDTQIHLISQNDKNLYKVKDFTEKGFVIHPFVGIESFLLRQDNLFSTAFVGKEKKDTLPSPILSPSARVEYQSLFGKALKAIDKGGALPKNCLHQSSKTSSDLFSRPRTGLSYGFLLCFFSS